jgi:hypothetical protein
MNHLSKIIASLFILSGMVYLNSCVKGDLDTPTGIPHVDFSSNKSITQLLAMHTAGGLELITDDVIVQGVVVGNDKSGNLYKQIIIEDDSSGLQIQIDAKSLYVSYKLGQRVFVKCKGLALGEYHGLVQLGYIVNDAIGRVPSDLISQHLFNDGLPGAIPAPLTLTIPALTQSGLNKLVKFDNVHFQDVGLPYSDSCAATSRNILDAGSNVIIMRTSNFANFRATHIPAGTGSVTGILTIYNSGYQIVIRDLSDVLGFN